MNLIKCGANILHNWAQIKLRLNAFTFGRLLTSLMPLSLHYDFTSVIDVDALLGWLATEFPAVKCEPRCGG